VDIVSKQLMTARVSHNSSLEGPELSKRDALITQLVAQSESSNLRCIVTTNLISHTFHFFTDKELMATKDRQEIELSAQRVTLEEQRTHIDILDTALTNAQTNVVRLEEEVNNVNIM